ncbi:MULTISPECIES: hypothetical protein [Trichocoleus]|uniref:Uncharacterized protein n=1 Tax=Trichocoleus desertorum GB2-A4 TaxID=2933944 RepID=A0ABV0JFF7_9CYAN|nr:hypothetical protein [Trichocoleus sp. FACHB-46]MBD1864527.1 hypothetical protein [Trichocoleus sp. FACHB-46]
MSSVEQLELQLWASLSEATEVPEAAELDQLWQLLDLTLVDQETPKQLAIAAEAIAQITEVFQERSVQMFEELEAATSEEGPVMPTDAFDRYVHQSMQVDLEQFIEPPLSWARKVPQRSPWNSVENERSVVGELDQAALLQVLDEQMSQDPGLTEAEVFNRALGVAHEEDMTAWVEAINYWMQASARSSVSLLELQRSLEMPLVQVWLALLLGDCPLEQRGEFYEAQQVWVVEVK